MQDGTDARNDAFRFFSTFSVTLCNQTLIFVLSLCTCRRLGSINFWPSPVLLINTQHLYNVYKTGLCFLFWCSVSFWMNQRAFQIFFLNGQKHNPHNSYVGSWFVFLEKQKRTCLGFFYMFSVRFFDRFLIGPLNSLLSKLIEILKTIPVHGLSRFFGPLRVLIL